MKDTKNLLVRAKTCLGCHLGDGARQVDHRLIAAGHPDLVFELDTFCVTQPAHWKESGEKGEWFGARQWAVGQAVALAESMKLLARRSRDSAWPEFADYECFACHHGLVKKSDRIVRGYRDAPGLPRWNSARYAVFRHLLERVDAPTSRAIETDLRVLEAALREGWKDREGAAATAERIAAAVEPIGAKLADSRTPITGDLVAEVLGAIAANAGEIAGAGYRAAEQAALAVDALYRPYLRNVKRAEAGSAGKLVDRIFASLGDPNRFQPAEFTAALRAVGEGVNAGAAKEPAGGRGAARGR
jgi:hypothetical protein